MKFFNLTNYCYYKVNHVLDKVSISSCHAKYYLIGNLKTVIFQPIFFLLVFLIPKLLPQNHRARAGSGLIGVPNAMYSFFSITYLW